MRNDTGGAAQSKLARMGMSGLQPSKESAPADRTAREEPFAC